MVVTNVIFEDGRFLKVVKRTVYSPVAPNRVITSIDRDGIPTYVDATEFPRAHQVEEKHPATFIQWLMWKLFKVHP